MNVELVDCYSGHWKERNLETGKTKKGFIEEEPVRIRHGKEGILDW